MPPLVKRWRLTVDDYHRMAKAGILREDDRVELIEGEIVEMAPIGSRHAACVNRFTRLFGRHLHERAVLAVQNPLHLNERSEVQPDVALLRVRSDDYAGSHPGPVDVMLVVEVSDTSAGWDRHHKLPLYATAGVPEVWLVDLTPGIVELWNAPQGASYRERRVVGAGGQVAPQAFPDVVLRVAELLPPHGRETGAVDPPRG